MEKVIEQKLLRYVVATLDKEGRTFFLRSQRWGKYDMVDKVEYASKIVGQDTAIEFYKTARQDLGPHVELVLLPLIITYELINEVDGDGTFDSI